MMLLSSTRTVRPSGLLPAQDPPLRLVKALAVDISADSLRRSTADLPERSMIVAEAQAAQASQMKSGPSEMESLFPLASVISTL